MKNIKFLSPIVIILFIGLVLPVSAAVPPPSVDIEIDNSDGPITVDYDEPVELEWTSTNSNYCYASGNWSGIKSTSGSYETEDIRSSKIYTITCSNSYGSVSDSIRVYVEEDEPDYDVILKASPSSGCDPLKDVDLEADIQGSVSGSMTYKFDCTANGSWDKTVTTSSERYNASNVCDYNSPGIYTARVRVEKTGKSPVEDTVRIEVNNCNGNSNYNNGFYSLDVEKKVRKISDNFWSDSIYVNPNEIVSFYIRVRSTNSSDLTDVIVTDTLGRGIIYRGNLKVDGRSIGGDIRNGVNVGDLDSGNSKTITFDAQIASTENFGNGTTIITTVGSAKSCTAYDSASVKISIYKQGQVLGAATFVSTGLTNNVLFDSLIIPIIIALITLWLFKSKILRFEEWLDMAKDKGFNYKSKKELQERLSQIRKNESK